jgi:glycine cleavage system aminomethyltransferase T
MVQRMRETAVTTGPDQAPAIPAGVTRSPLLARHGAVEGEGPDAGVAAHYGDPMREQRLLAEGLAVVDLSHRGVVTVTGPDRLSWLHSVTTQMLNGLAPRQSRESLVLSPKGHIEHDLHLVDDVGELVAALASNLFAKTTGAQIPVDGGSDRVV